MNENLFHSKNLHFTFHYSVENWPLQQVQENQLSLS